MATIKDRLLKLERSISNAHNELVLIIDEIATDQQQAQIEQAERAGQQVKPITIIHAEKLFPDFVAR
ncbi:MAG: hypothetical protein Q7U78_10840 [Gallionella sp.]|nr:hypothetical protein [Gallionella sp.]